MLLQVIAILVFLAVVGVVVFVFSALETRNARARILRDRLATLDNAAQRNPSEDLALLREELLSDIPAVNKLLTRYPRIVSLQSLLSQADMKIRAGTFLLISVTAALVTGLLAAYLAGWWVWGIVFGAVAGPAPLFYVSIMRSRRFHKFESMFPEAVDLLGRAVRAGHAFTTAIELIATELAEPIAGEFRILFEEQKFGLPVRDAMLNLAERVPIVDVKFFVTAVLLQRETGGNLAEILDKLSYVIRERFKILRQVRVYTAHGRITMAILMSLPLALGGAMAVLNPEFMKPLFRDPIGHVMIAASVLMQTMGFFLIRRIIRIKV
jgi:tight adherence protein B